MKAILLLTLSVFAFADWGGLLSNIINSKKNTNLQTITTNDKITALKDALSDGAKYAISSLSKKNGYLDNANVKIPLPSSMQKAASIVKKYGGAKYVNNFEAAINHAAEKAVPQTYSIFLNSIKKMTIKDAGKLLKGGKNSATNFFKEKDSKLLYKKIYPIIQNSIKKINVMKYYQSLKKYYQKYMPSTPQTNNNSLFGTIVNIAKTTGAKKYMMNLSEKSLNDYVTKKSVSGIFYMISKQEEKIRANPLSATSAIVKKVFSRYK